MQVPRIVRYLPTALLAIITSLWTLSVLFAVTYSFDLPRLRSLQVSAIEGSLDIYLMPYPMKRGFRWAQTKQPPGIDTIMGRFAFRRGVPFYAYRVSCPFIVLLTALLPLAIGAQNRFRFPLWMWLAYTGLIAGQCAYFLG